MSAALREAAKAAVEEMNAIGKAFGAPGDYGYSTEEGKALFSLAKARVELANAIDAAEIEACPVCGNEERGQGGYLSCECPAAPTNS